MLFYGMSMNEGKKVLVTLGLCLAFFVVYAAPALSGPCEDLADLVVPDTTITTAEAILPPWTSPMGMGSATAMVSFCRVVAVSPPAINFEVWMPPSTEWNGRFWGVGNGAFAGGINYPSMNQQLAVGSATASTDTGHVSGVFDASWAIGHPELIDDWARRSVNVMTVAAKAIIEAFYGEAPTRSYFSGCSGGGRQALREAQDFPDDYDGILVGAPARHETHMIPGMLWNATVTLKDPTNYIPASKLPLIESAALARCDSIDGMVDGLIDDPRNCDFDPATLECAGADADTCLTTGQVDALKKIYGGAQTSTGDQIYPGFLPGAETGPGGWAGWITGSAPNTSFDYLVGTTYGKYMVFENPTWDWTTFDFDTDVEFIDTKLGYINGNNPDLSAFNARGGKMLMYHGWGDPAIAALDSIAYYGDVVETMTGVDITSFFRLFMMPGVQHCSGGSGPYSFDGTGAVQKWVEEDVVPVTIVASHSTSNVVDRTRPLCPYPQVARYLGSGSIDEAESFACVTLVPAQVDIKQTRVKIGKGAYVANLTIPEGYSFKKKKEIVPVVSQGASAISTSLTKKKTNLAARFRMKDVIGITPGDAVPFTMTAIFSQGGKTYAFEGSDTVNVLAK